MVTRRDYTAEAIEACKSVLIELVHLLGEFGDHIVLVGGWIPGLLLPGTQEAHIGTIDIDLALDFQRIPEETYKTILEALRGRGYRQDPRQPFRFYRDVPVPGRDPIIVEVDFLAGEYGGTGSARRTQQAQDLRARKARGCDLVFFGPSAVTLEGELPGGGRDRVTIRVAAIVPWLVMKGMALAERMKEKDAYDIYYCVRHYPGGPAALAAEFQPHLDNKLIREGLGKIRSAFQSVDHHGPRWVADFLDVTDSEDRAILQRRVFEVVTEWLNGVGIEPWS